MMNVLQQMMSGAQGTQTPKTEAELLHHQKPLASAMKTLLDIAYYEKSIVSPDVYVQMIESLQQNLNEQLDQLKIVIPPADEIVTINGNPATITK